MKPGGIPSRDKFRESTARLLVAILASEQHGKQDMAELILGRNSGMDNFRQAKQRFREDMEGITGKAHKEFQPEDVNACLPRLPPGLILYGAISKHGYLRRG